LALKILIDQETGKLRECFKEDKNHAWYCAGCAFFDACDFEKAKKSFLRAHFYQKNDCQSLIACANCFSEMKKPECAEILLRKTLKKNPERKDRVTIIYNLGNALFDQRLYEAAIESYSLVSRRRDATGSLARKNIAHARWHLMNNFANNK